MRNVRTWIAVTAVVAAGAAGWAVALAASATPSAPAGPAPAPASAVIDAARFPTLQAALGAVPAGGGLVQLPPGAAVVWIRV